MKKEEIFKKEEELPDSGLLIESSVAVTSVGSTVIAPNMSLPL